MEDTLIGKRIGRLLVIKKLEYPNFKYPYNPISKPIKYYCKCYCGKETIVYKSSLTSGKIKSCGCYNKEINTTHGESKTKLYKVWQHMRERCYNNKTDRYKNYGGRGIKIYKPWLDFLYFKEWALKTGYIDGLSIERIDVNDDYKPNNCKWIAINEQCHNKCNSIYVKYKNKIYSLKDFAKINNEYSYKYLHRHYKTYGNLIRFGCSISNYLEYINQ